MADSFVISADGELPFLYGDSDLFGFLVAYLFQSAP